MASSPTSRTLDLLRKEGWTARVVEKWIPYTKVKQDCFGFDVLAARAHAGARNSTGETLGVQATSGANHSARKAKALKNREVAVWLAAGNYFEVWSWSKKGARGARKLWTVRREALTLSDFIPEG